MEALKATDVTHAYGKNIPVLNNFNLTLAPGAFEVLMGPSGSGKSTFLHLAAALLTADSGTISIGGTEVTSLGDSAAARFRRRHVGVIFQNFNLLETLTVADNVTLPTKLDHTKTNTARRDDLLERLGLTKLANCRPNELSGGERQRVAIARALYAEPDVILADEPTGNLDVNAAKKLCDLLKKLNTEEKSAILLVTHDPVVAAAASKVHFLKDGRIAASFETHHNPTEISKRYLETYG